MEGYEGRHVDSDVHCAPASIKDLEPYLDVYWVEFIAGSTIELYDNPSEYPRAARNGPTPPDVETLATTLLDVARPQAAILTCLSMLELYRNPTFSAVAARALNDWLRAEWLDRDPRLRASMIVSGAHVDDAVAEVERLRDDKRFVQILLPIRSDAPYGHPRYHDLYEIAEREGLVVGLHAWGYQGAAMTPTGVASTFAENYTSNMRTVQRQITSLVCEGVFSKFPDLRVALLECGFTWLPHLAARFDKEWKGLYREVPWLTNRPSEYIQRHMRASTAPAHLGRNPRHAQELVAMVGADWLMYASDYPHRHGDDGTLLLQALTPAERDAVAFGNATAFYRLGDESRSDSGAKARAEVDSA